MAYWQNGYNVEADICSGGQVGPGAEELRRQLEEATIKQSDTELVLENALKLITKLKSQLAVHQEREGGRSSPGSNMHVSMSEMLPSPPKPNPVDEQSFGGFQISPSPRFDEQSFGGFKNTLIPDLAQVSSETRAAIRHRRGSHRSDSGRNNYDRQSIRFGSNRRKTDTCFEVNRPQAHTLKMPEKTRQERPQRGPVREAQSKPRSPRKTIQPMRGNASFRPPFSPKKPARVVKKQQPMTESRGTTTPNRAAFKGKERTWASPKHGFVRRHFHKVRRERMLSPDAFRLDGPKQSSKLPKKNFDCPRGVPQADKRKGQGERAQRQDQGKRQQREGQGERQQRGPRFKQIKRVPHIPRRTTTQKAITRTSKDKFRTTGPGGKVPRVRTSSPGSTYKPAFVKRKVVNPK